MSKLDTQSACPSNACLPRATTGRAVCTGALGMKALEKLNRATRARRMQKVFILEKT